MKYTVINMVITLVLSNSCFQQSLKSSDFVIGKAENSKFAKDARSVGPIGSKQLWSSGSERTSTRSYTSLPHIRSSVPVGVGYFRALLF